MAQEAQLHAHQDITALVHQIRIKNAHSEHIVLQLLSNQHGVRLVCMALETRITLMSLPAVLSAAEVYSQPWLHQVNVLTVPLVMFV